VLDTDYDNYAFVWSCKEYCIGEWCMGHRPLFWLLERDVDLAEEEYTGRLDQAFEALKGFTSGTWFKNSMQTGVAYDEHSLEKLRNKMSRSIQENCDFYATTTTEVPVTTETPVEEGMSDYEKEILKQMKEAQDLIENPWGFWG